MEFVFAIPALPVKEMSRSIAFFRDTLGFAVAHHEGGFAVLKRDVVELHLWQADDESWRTRTGGEPVTSGAESFLAGTASCRISVVDVEALYRDVEPRGVVHPRAQLGDQPWGTREFGILDPDNNLVTFFERR